MTLKMPLSLIVLSQMITILSFPIKQMMILIQYSQMNRKKSILEAFQLTSVQNYIINVCGLMDVQATKRHSWNYSKLREILRPVTKNLNLSTHASLTTGTDLVTWCATWLEVTIKFISKNTIQVLMCMISRFASMLTSW